MRPSGAGAAVRRAVARLALHQLPHGEFRTFWSPAADLRAPVYAESPFLTAMVLLALRGLPGQAGAVTRRAAPYLRSRRRPDHLFAFLDAGIDPDLDDTCLIHALLRGSGPAAAEQRALAVRIAALPRSGGLFRTWLRAHADAENDVDPCVSVNVLRFLHGHGLAARDTERALREAARSSAFDRGTLYYHPPLSLPWWLATLPAPARGRVLDPPLRATLRGRALALADEGDATATDLAMALLVAVRCAAAPSSCAGIAAALLAREAGYGAWPGSAVFRAFNFWGSDDLTTALVAQALWEYHTTTA